MPGGFLGAAFQPGPADRAAVRGGPGDFEAAVAGELRGVLAVQDQILAPPPGSTAPGCRPWTRQSAAGPRRPSSLKNDGEVRTTSCVLSTPPRRRGSLQGAAGQGAGRGETGGHEPEVVPGPGSLGFGHRCGAVGTVVGVVVRAAGGVLVVDGVGVDVVQRRAGVQHGRGPGGVRPGLLRIEDPDLRGDVAEQVQQQEVPRPAPGLQGGVLVRGEQHGQFPAAGQEGLEAGGEQGARGVGRCADGPVLLRPEQQPFAVRAEVHVHRDVELHPLPVAQHRGGLLEEADPVHGEGPLEARGRVVRHERHHVVFGDFEQPLRRGQGSAAAQLDAGPGVGGRGAGQSLGRGGDQQGVGVEPGGVALRRRQVEAAGRRVHEAAGLDVELAVAVRVAAVGGEGQERPPVRLAVGRAQEAGAVEDPFLAFRRGQGVHIQQDVPLR